MKHRKLILWALILLTGVSLRAQSNYATPYAFSTLAGTFRGQGSSDGSGSAARFSAPFGLATDISGNVYVADSGNNTIRQISPAGVVTTLAGTAGLAGSADGAGNAARFNRPWGLAMDVSGNLYVADSGNNTIRQISPSGVVTTLAGLAGVTGSADGPGAAARFNFPAGLTVDSLNNVYIADSGNNTIRQISPSGVVTTLAGLAGSAGSADGTGSSARFSDPLGVAVDSARTVYVADTANNTIRKITGGGVVTTLAGSPSRPGDPVGIYGFPPPYGQGSTDGIGSAAWFWDPCGLAVDSGGTVYVADSANCTVRKITSGGVVTTLAGMVGVVDNVDGVGSAVRFYTPRGVTVDRQGNLFVSDISADTVRKGALAPPALSSPATAAAAIGRSFTYATAFAGAPASVSASGLPPGLGFDPTTGVISGTATMLGTFAVSLSATNGAGTGAATLVLTVGYPGRLANLSARAVAGTGDSALIAGAVIGGSGTSGPEPLLLRAVGPTLTGYGVAGALADPYLVWAVQAPISAGVVNDNWGGDPQITSIGNAIGAFPLISPTSLDAALYLTPLSGIYSMRVSSGAGASGIVLAEIYDASSSSYTPTTPRLINLSARAQVGSGTNVLIAGLVVTGSSPVTVLIRGVGPTLTNYGVGGALSDPQLVLSQVVNGSTVTVASNDNWGGDPQIAAAITSVGAFPLSSAASKDAAILITLPPGIYSAMLSGVGGTTGIGLVEVYEVP